MPWCPNCKLEYVSGKKICPDCNVELVESLDEESKIPMDLNLSAIMKAQAESEQADLQEMQASIYAKFKEAAEMPKYTSIEETYDNNRSGAGVLIFCGLLGITVLVLNVFGIINIPMAGFGLTLTYVVMGCLFLVFLASGVRSAIKCKTLKPLVEIEKQNIEKAVSFLKQNKSNGVYVLSDGDYAEMDYIGVYEQAIKDLNLFIPDAAPGFSIYVCDKYLGDILDED